MDPHLVRHVAASAEGDVFATAAFERTVTVWSLPRRQAMATFETVLDFGGRRLAIAGGARPTLVAGAYIAEGVAAYEVVTGERRWHRKDLKAVQHVSVSGAAGLVAVGLDRGALHLLRLTDGETIRTFRGARQAVPGPGGVLLVGRGWVAFAEPEGEVRWRRKGEFWGCLDAAVGDGSALLSLQGPHRAVCLDLASGGERWAYERSGWSLGRVVWCERDGLWRGVEGRGGTNAVYRVVDLNPHGERVAQGEWCDSGEAEFLAGGTQFVRSQGEVRALPGMEVVWGYAARRATEESGWSPEELTPLRQAVIRNYERRRLRHWAVFRELAGGVPVPDDAFRQADQMLVSYYDTEVADEYGCCNPALEMREFEAHEFPEAIAQYLGAQVVVLLSEHDRSATHGFLASRDRAVSALSNDVYGDISFVDLATRTLAQVAVRDEGFAMRVGRQLPDESWERFFLEEE